MPKVVPPELRREWLRRIEEKGDSVPQIHADDFYDVRTIRKAIQWARDDREQREARRLVYRRALEAHYADIVAFAEQLDSELIRDNSISLLLTSNRLWSAMRQHLPRSPIWQASNRLNDLNDEIKDLEDELRVNFIKNSNLDNDHRFLADITGLGLNSEGVSRAFVHRLKTNESIALRFSRYKPGILEATYGPYNLGLITEKDEASMGKYLDDLLTLPKMKASSEKLKGKLAAREKIVQTITDGLATIKLKRVLSGHCKYCPL